MSPTKRTKKNNPIETPVVETPTLFDAPKDEIVESSQPLIEAPVVVAPEVKETTPSVAVDSTEITPLVGGDKLTKTKKKLDIPYALIGMMLVVLALLASSVYYIGFVHRLELVVPDNLTLKVAPAEYIVSVNYPGDSESLTVLNDGDLTTHYSTAVLNDQIVRFEIDLATPRVMSQVVISPRTDAWTNGLIEELRLFARVNNEMILLGDYRGLRQEVQILSFVSVETSHLELLVTGHQGNRVTMSELALYERDVLREQIAAALVDDEPRPGLNQAEIDRLVQASQSHPMKTEFLETLNRVQLRMLGSGGAIYPLSGLPSEVSEQARMRTLYTMNSLEPTGLYATPGEAITITYDQLANNTELTVCFSRYYGLHEDSYSCVPITQSPTTLVTPLNYLGPIYLQFRAPFDAHMRVEIDGGTAFPIYRSGTSVALYEDELAAYHQGEVQLPDPSILGSGIDVNAKLDITELVSDQIMITLPMRVAYDAYVNDPKHDAQLTLSEWDARLTDMIALLGFDQTAGMNHTPYLRENLRAMTSSALTHVQDRFVSLNINPTLYEKVLLEPTAAYSTDLITELSSRYSLDAYNNFYAMDNAMVQLLVDYQLYQLGESYLMSAPEILNKLFSDLYKPDLDFATLTSVEQMAIHWQISQYYGFEWYGQAMRTIRQSSHLMNHATLIANSSDWIMIVSTVVNQDLSAFFDRYNLPLTDSQREQLSALNPAPEVLSYVDADFAAIDPQGVPFWHRADIASITQVGNSYRLSIAIDPTIEDQILGYFIYRDGIEIGFTSSSTYIDNSAQIGDLHRYSVRPLTRRGKRLASSALSPLRSLWYPRDFNFLSICQGVFCTSPDQYDSLFDNRETVWQTSINVPHTLIVEMQQPQKFYGMSVTLPSTFATGNLQSFTIATSDDGIHWNNALFTATFEEGDDSLSRGIYFSNPVSTRFIKIQVTGFDDGLRIEELDVYVESSNPMILWSLGILGGLIGLAYLSYFVGRRWYAKSQKASSISVES